MLLRACAAGLWLIPALMFCVIDFRDCLDELPRSVLVPALVRLLAFAVLAWLTWRVLAVRILGAALGVLLLAFTCLCAPAAPFAVRQLEECGRHGNDTLGFLFFLIYFPLQTAWMVLAVIAAIWTFVRWGRQSAPQRHAQTPRAD